MIKRLWSWAFNREVLLYGNYTCDIMNFDMAAEMLEMDDIEVKSIVGADDVISNKDASLRRGATAGKYLIEAINSYITTA